jgi:Mn-containing catalase
MFFHHKELAYTVRCDKPNPVFGRMLQEAIGGPAGELRVMTQYLFQGFGYRGPAKYKDMLLSTATEEIGHVEVLSTAVAMNLEGAPSAMFDDVITNPAVSARMGAFEPKHYLLGGLGAMPGDADGVPFNAACVDLSGNLAANMHANAAAEAVGRTLAVRLLELTDDPGMQDMLKYLIARDTMHQQQWLAVLEELGPEISNNAPGDYENEPEYAQFAYAFLDHLADRDVDPAARFATGPSLDGKGEFSLAAPPHGNAPDLAKAPPSVHAGLEATGPAPSKAEGIVEKAKDAVKDAVS